MTGVAGAMPGRGVVGKPGVDIAEQPVNEAPKTFSIAPLTIDLYEFAVR